MVGENTNIVLLRIACRALPEVYSSYYNLLLLLAGIRDHDLSGNHGLMKHTLYRPRVDMQTK